MAAIAVKAGDEPAFQALSHVFSRWRQRRENCLNGRQALSLEPSWTQLWLLRARVALRQGRAQDAQRALERFERAGGSSPEAARLVALAPTASEAEAVARRGAQWLVDSYAGPQHAHRKSMQRTYDGKDPTQYYVDSIILHGTPGSVVEQIGRLKEEIGLNHLMCAPLSRETFHLLADQVLPKL